MDNENKVQEENTTSENKSFIQKVGDFFAKIFQTLARWIKRMFMGGSKELDKFAVEEIDSPSKQAVKAFFRNKLAVVALCIFVCMFLLVIIGPLVLPMDVNYVEPLHQNLAPGYSMMSVPGELKGKVKNISSFSSYSVGLSTEGKLYVWGVTTGSTLADIPAELKNNKVSFVAAGYDHAIAITEKGKVVGWGKYNQAQYGTKGSLYGSDNVINMPDELINGTIDVNNVKSITCGYQVTAIVMKDGSSYVWGNVNSGAYNAKEFVASGISNVDKIVFLNASMVALLKDGSIWIGTAVGQYGVATITSTKQQVNLLEYTAGKTVTDVATTGEGIAFVVDGKEILTAGVVIADVPAPELDADESIKTILGGARHYTIVTDKNRAISFGGSSLGQCTDWREIKENSTLYVGSFQNYLVDSDNKLYDSWGLKGYLMGTDDFGRDVFVRIVHGGMMTMSIGAVAVIISSIIGIVIGVISGYFGGWVDMLLMRVTEVFSAIPFLPFALILSSVLAGADITEDTRIFMIMVILGLLSWTGLAHMVRGQVLAEREKEFVLAAKAIGVKESRIAFKHILPNVISVILVSMTLDFAGCMLTESSLSYLGFGVALPRPTWGNMLDGCQRDTVIANYWWRWLFPAVFLLVTTVCVNIIGDTLRDVFDPKSNAER